MKKIELLAPAKNRDSAFAAIDYGADAIYIGGTNFGARHAAANSIDEIAAVVQYAHAYGVRVHCTLNTILYEAELRDAEKIAREVIAAGVDALIVQDMAFARMGLDVDLHASTQMCNMTPEGILFLEQCGFSRIVLERALSLKQILTIAQSSSVELEAFVHGAICVGHSGRCYLSRSQCERSGNRGECSQPCRLPYDLSDANGRKILEGKHLLSVRDLNLSAQIGTLLDAGITSFKIEGRLKDIGYTKNIVAHYRTTLDKQLAERPALCRSSQGVSHIDFVPNPSKSFTRGESEYLFWGQRANLASLDTPKSVGERIGKVTTTRSNKFRIDSHEPLQAGDGICFITPEGMLGTNINKVEQGWIEPNRMEGIAKGVEIFRNLDKAFNDSLESSRTRRTIGICATLHCVENYIELSYEDREGNTARVSREGEFEPARNEGKMREVAQSQITKSGDTIFSIEEVSFEGECRFIASSLLAEMRREALSVLHTIRLERYTKPAPFVENKTAKLHKESLTAEDNVTNSLSKRFYTDHGATTIEWGHDLSAQFDEQRVMQSSYCIRREIGECLKQGSQLRNELYIERGGARYRLEFDCKKCRMNLICTDKKNYE